MAQPQPLAPDRKTSSTRAWLVWALGAACFGYAFFQRVSPSAMVSDLMRDFGVGAAVLGNLSAIYFFAYASLQIPVGVLLDRWGARRMLAISIAVAGSGSAVLATAKGIEQAYVGRLLVGIGSSVGFVGTLKLASRWFQPSRFAFVAGLTMLVAMSFGVMGQAPLAAVVQEVGWRPSMLAAGLYGAVLAALIWFIVRDTPDPRAEHDANGAVEPILPGLRKVLATPRNWVLAAYAGAMSGPMLAYAGLWGVPHMMQRNGIERPIAAASASVLLIGWAVGSPLSGWISDRLGRRKLPMVTGSALTLVCWLLHLYVPLPLAVTWVLLFLIGAFSSAMVISYAMAREFASQDAAGALTGFVNMATVGMGAVLQPVIGLLLDANWQGAMENGVPTYDLTAYDAAFLVIPACCVAALTAGLATKESFGVSRPE